MLIPALHIVIALLYNIITVCIRHEVSMLFLYKEPYGFFYIISQTIIYCFFILYFYLI